MKILVFFVAILLVIGSFSLNANSNITPADNRIEAPSIKITGFKKDISVAD
ncbi:hypothetical protein LJ707_00230 [Mucilaginibacter sp. UR6-1]|uniref:hypothetical protein n=1 Tax=Mucilaginibacter sp. UR6-1 TaxID=1435643 RepID=UPI001E603B0C|nr:hypothetical protein [Mucilaginibacter sp. UR6-1]MCC8407338.1 hypothetical protein [Mucilaginibacter sp. UR6-1]